MMSTAVEARFTLADLLLSTNNALVPQLLRAGYLLTLLAMKLLLSASDVNVAPMLKLIVEDLLLPFLLSL